jgi:hypothetical protein
MVDLAEIQAAYYMVAATGVLVAAGYYVLNMSARDAEIKIAGMHMISIVGGKLKDWWAVEDHLGWYRQLGLELKQK